MCSRLTPQRAAEPGSVLWTPELGWLVVLYQRNELPKGVTEAVGVQGRWNLLSGD